MSKGPQQIEGITFESSAEPRQDGGHTIRIRFLVNDSWTAMHEVDILGEVTGGAHWAAVEQELAKVKTGERLHPLGAPSRRNGILRLDSMANGTRRA